MKIIEFSNSVSVYVELLKAYETRIFSLIKTGSSCGTSCSSCGSDSDGSGCGE